MIEGLWSLPPGLACRCLLAAGRPLILLQYRHVSMRLCRVVPTATDIAHAAVQLLDAMHLPQVRLPLPAGKGEVEEERCVCAGGGRGVLRAGTGSGMQVCYVCGMC